METARRTRDRQVTPARPRIWDPWAVAIAAAATAVAACLSAVVFGRIPHVQDSIAQLFQARIFASGRLWAPAPALPQFFEYTHMIIRDGRWYSQYPPGHALLLVPGVWLGAPWLINPLLGGITLFGVYALGRELFDRATARLAALLGLLSPFLLLMSAEFMSHAASLCALTYYLLFYARTIRSHRIADGLLAGACLGLAVLIRPYSALGMALPTAIHGALALRRDRPGLAKPILALALCSAGAVVLLLLYNWATTGSPTRFGYEVLYGKSHGLGFGRGTWGPPHTLARGLHNATDTLAALSGRLFEWPVTSLWPIVLGLLLPATGLALRRRWWLAAFPASLLAVHVFYWYHDLCFGPRFIYEALAPLLLLAACGLIAGVARVRDGWPAIRRHASLAWLAPLGLVAVLSICGGVTRWPRMFTAPSGVAALPPESPLRQGSYFRYFGREFWGVSPYLGELVRARVRQPAIVFTRFREPDAEVLPIRYLTFGSAFAHERPLLARARVIFARDLGARNAELMRQFPDRKVYLYRGSIRAGVLDELR